MKAVESQISALVSGLNKKSFKQTSNELDALIKEHGVDARITLMKELFAQVNLLDGKSGKDQSQHTMLLSQDLLRLIEDESLGFVLFHVCEAQDAAIKAKFVATFLTQLHKLFRFNVAHEVIICLSLVGIQDPDIEAPVNTHLRIKLPELLKSGSDVIKAPSLTIKAQRRLLYLMQYPEKLVLYNVTIASVNEFLSTLRSLVRSHVETGVADDEAAFERLKALSSSLNGRGAELAAILREVGHVASSSIFTMRQVVDLALPSSLDTAGLASCLVAMANLIHPVSDALSFQPSFIDGLKSGDQDGPSSNSSSTIPPHLAVASWNIDNFITVLNEKIAMHRWEIVFENFDIPQFKMESAEAVAFLVRFYRRACGASALFPVHVFYRAWRNPEGQFTFLKQLVDPSNEGIAELTEIIQQSTPHLLKEHLKTHLPNPTACPWMSLPLTNAIFQLGKTSLNPSVRSLLHAPVQEYPDIVALAVSESATLDMNVLHQELILGLVAVLLDSNTNMSSVLHRIQTLHPSAVLRALVMWYQSNPAPSRLIRVQDVAQDMKILPQLLSVNEFPFVIEIAIITAQRDFLKLDKWLAEKLRSQALIYGTAAVTFLANKLQNLSNNKNDPIQFDSLITVLRTLEQNASLLPPELAKFVKQISDQVQMSPFSPSINITAPSLSLSTPTNPPAPIGSNPVTKGPLQDPILLEVNNKALPPPSLPGNPGLGSAPPGLFPGTEDFFGRTISKEIDDKSNGFFREVFLGNLAIEEFIARLSNFRQSSDSNERDIFVCSVRNLFDEYKYFENYPPKELGIMTALFTALIQKQLLPPSVLSVALKLVLDSLQKDTSSAFFRFGVAALSGFPDRLKEFPPFCQVILSLPSFVALPPQLASLVQASAQSEGKKPPPGLGGDSVPSSSSSGPSTSLAQKHNLPPLQIPPIQPQAPQSVTPNQQPKTPSSEKSVFGTNLQILLAATETVQLINIPAESVVEKVSFICNNLSQTNLKDKAKDFNNHVQPSMYEWFAQYLVVRRVSIEANFHVLYLSFVDHLDRLVAKLVLAETYRNINVLLGSTKIAASGSLSERSLLKNLGSWLGLQTLAKNKPILYVNLPLKNLIVESCGQGPQNLIYIIPFVAKVLEGCKNSKIFKPPNPWLMAIMSLLKELYSLPELRLNLKFEIEVLCKALNLAIEDIVPSAYLSEYSNSNHLAVLLRQPNQNIGGGGGGNGSGGPSLSQGGQGQPNSINFVNPSSAPLSPKPNIAEKVAAGGMSPVMTPPPAHVRAANFPTLTANNIVNFININSQIQLFQLHPALKPAVLGAVELAIHEIVDGAVERSVNVAISFTIRMVTKDFLLEADESKLRRSSHAMVQHLAGSLAMVNSKESLKTSIETHLKALILKRLGSLPIDPKLSGLIDQAVALASSDNLDLAAAFVEKQAMERAVAHIDQVLGEEYAQRKRHRETRPGSQFASESIMRFAPAIQRLPPPLRPRASGLDSSQLSLYENYGTFVAPVVAGSTQGGIGSLPAGPGPVPNSSGSDSLPGPGQQQGGLPPASSQIHQQQLQLQQQQQQLQAGRVGMDISINNILGETFAALDKALNDLQNIVTRITRTPGAPPPNAELGAVVKDIQTLLERSPLKVDAVIYLSRKVFTSLFETDPISGKPLLDIFEHLLINMQESFGCVTKDITTQFVKGEEAVLRSDIIGRLLKGKLIDWHEFDAHCNKLFEKGSQKVFSFVADVLYDFFLNDSNALSEFRLSAELFRHGAMSSKLPQTEKVRTLLETLSKTTSKTPRRNDRFITRVVQVREDPSDPQHFKDFIALSFEEWLKFISHSPDKVQTIIPHLQAVINKSDDMASRFFRMWLDFSIGISYYQLTVDGTPARLPPTHLSYVAPDAFVKLVFVVTRQSSPEQKLVMLNKILLLVTETLLTDQLAQGSSYNQKPYFRILCRLLFESTSLEEPLVEPFLLSFGTVLHATRPSIAPAFAFGWLELVSHRLFVPRLMNLKRSSLVHDLLLDHLKFLYPLLNAVELSDSTKLLYKGTLRVLLVLLHDFPEFLCEYHFSFCDAIPLRCTQIRNVILSAYPRNSRLPDPFIPSLKVDTLVEIAVPPRILSRYEDSLETFALKGDLDVFLRDRPDSATSPFLAALPARLMLTTEEGIVGVQRYNIPLINSLVMYCGIRALESVSTSSTPSEGSMTNNSSMDIYKSLLDVFDPDGRYVLLNSLSNHLRYPNSHTYYYTCVIRYLFQESSKEIVKEQITRVLLERLLSARPHPWGLLVTFIELIKNPIYQFWTYSFVRCAPEIERLFSNVLRSCEQPRPS